jgi:hypothetical protein
MPTKKHLLFGLFCLLIAALFGWSLSIVNAPLEKQPLPLLGMFVSILLAITLLIPWGRPYTPRVTMAFIGIGLLVLVVWLLIDQPQGKKPWNAGGDLKDMVLLILIGFASIIAIYYSLTGKYARDWPFSEIFAQKQAEERPPDDHSHN